MISWKTALPLLCLSALTVIGTLGINHSFRSGLDDQIRDEDRRLESAVYRAYYREYQRTTLLVHSLNQINFQSEEELMRALENMMITYGSEGQGLISAAWFQSGDQVYELTEPLTAVAQWKRISQVPPTVILDRPLSPGDIQIRDIDRDKSRDPYLLHSPDGRILIALKLDSRKIESLYAEPAVQETLAGYELEWIDMDRDEYRELMEENRRMKYPFSPLQVLAGIPHGAHIKLMISLPSSLDYRYPDGPPPDEKEGLFIDGSPFHFSGRVLMVGFENAPYYHEMEKRTVLVWLLSQLILYGTVLVFMVLSLQLRKTRELRNREKEFVASMTHELRTPLTVIQSAADNLSRGIVPPENISRYGEVMKDQSSRLSGMIEEILMFSSLEGRTGSPGRAVPMDLPDLLNELKEGMEALAREKQTLLHWNSDGIPDKLRGYPDEIRLILSNLIVNALHHGISPGDEGIKITVRCLVSGRLKISVEDSGPGIPPKEQKKIFSPFYRSRSTREQQTRGSGLGLFIAMKKSRMIGGKLTLESPYRRLDGRKIQGCRFTLETPCEFPENSDSGDKN